MRRSLRMAEAGIGWWGLGRITMPIPATCDRTNELDPPDDGAMPPEFVRSFAIR
jgi:hypothetical protein